MKSSFRLLTAILIVSAVLFAASVQHPLFAWTSDNGNGTFTNPVLYGDYPDPDIIRVDSDFYLVTTTFVSVPGLEILHSKDLVNWTIAGYAAKTLDINPKYSLIDGNQYGEGVWAPALRYHDHEFYIIDNLQDVGTVIFRASKPSGPWTMNRLNGYLFDPGLMFDDDGTPLVYNGTGGRISVAVLDAGLTKVLSNTPAYTAKGEGSHAYKVNGTYYVFNSVFGQYPTLQCSRSTNRTGPFTTTIVCDTHVPWSSPHQGGMVQLQNGDWWGFSFVDSGAVGRDLWVGPITWSNGWPYFGDPAHPSIPTTNPMPKVGSFPITHPPTSDDFSHGKLGIQWQWNHNPDDSKWSVTARRGYLRLYTETAANFPSARNTLTLRTEGPSCTGVIKIDTSHLQPGDRAGLSLLEQYFGYLAVYMEANGQKIVRVVNTNGSLNNPSEDITDTIPGVNATTLWLQVYCDFKTQKARFGYSTDGKSFTQVGGDFPMHFTLSTFQGDRFGIFTYNPAGSAGWLDVDYFHQN
jgi:beta-xylosidase